jgi:hypothetical protein
MTAVSSPDVKDSVMVRLGVVAFDVHRMQVVAADGQAPEPGDSSRR